MDRQELHRWKHGNLLPASGEQGELVGWQFDFEKIIAGIKSRRLLIAFFSLLFAALFAGFAVYKLTNKIASAILIYESDLPKELPGGYILSNPSAYTLIDTIKLPANIQAVKAILGLSEPIEELEKMIVTPMPNTRSNLIWITAQGRDPQLVKNLANTLASVVVNNSRSYFQSQLQTAIDTYRQQMDTARQRLNTQNQTIEEFQKTHQVFEMGGENIALVNQLTSTRAQLDAARLNYDRILVEFESLKRQTEQLPARVALGGGSRNPMQTRVMALETALASARSRYTSDNPKVKKLELEIQQLLGSPELFGEEEQENLTQINVTKENLNVELIRMEGQVRAAQKVKENLTERLAEIEKKLETLPEYQVAFSALAQDRQRTVDQLKFLSQAIDTTQLFMNSPKGIVTLFQKADDLDELSYPYLYYLLPLLGLGVGMLFGASFAGILEIKDGKLRTPRQVEMAFGWQPITAIPELPHFSLANSERKMLFFVREIAEAIEQVESRDLASNPAWDGKLSIAVTSSTVREGKSCLAYHLARYYMDRLSKKVILIEMDFRPSPFTDFPKGSVALEQYLRGERELNAVILPGRPDRVRIASANSEMKELVKSDRMVELLATLRERYEVILLDAPGIIEDEYAANIAAMADLTLFVVGSSLVKKSWVEGSLAELERVDIKNCAIVLNRIFPEYVLDERVKQELKEQEKA